MANVLESAAVLVGILTPLVAVPLTFITFYLRSLRDNQKVWHGEFLRRAEMTERATAELRRRVRDFERDYTTKEEWLRESVLARRALERLNEERVRIDAAVRALFADGPAGAHGAGGGDQVSAHAQSGPGRAADFEEDN